MEFLDRESFLASARERGIVEDERYSPPRCLVYLPYREHDRFWEIPSGPTGAVYLALQLVRNFGDWRTVDLWPRGGQWPTVLAVTDHEEAIRTPVLTAAGVRPGWEGAIRYSRDEELQVIGIVAVQLMFGSGTYDDLFAVPDHGRYFIQTDHHGVVHVSAAEQRGIEAFAARMRAAGLELPTELPDQTFKRPGWLRDRVT
jgi:hypothetical protein